MQLYKRWSPFYSENRLVHNGEERIFLSLSNPPCAWEPQQNFFLSSESSQYSRRTSSAFRLRPTVTIIKMKLWIKNLGTTASVFVFVSTFLLEGDQNLDSTYILFNIWFSFNTEKKNVYFQLFIWNFIWLSLRTLSDNKDDVRLRTRNSRWRTTRVLRLRRQATKIIGWCKVLFVSFKKLFPSPFSANFERSGYIFGLISDWPTRAVLLC